MAEQIDPTALRWLIGGELARQRELAGMSLTDVASATDLPKTKINHMETARTAQRPEEVRQVLVACQASAESIERLVHVADRPQGKAWWLPWRHILADWNTLYLSLERMATKLFTYEVSAVHGLLQTREYATAITSQSPMVGSDNVERFVSLRMARAERLTTDPTITCHAILDESALYRRLAPPSVLEDQFNHLLELSDLPNVTLQVVGTDRGAYGGMVMGNYSILDFDSLNSVAYSELYVDALFIRDPDKVRSFQSAAQHVSSIALSPNETRKLISTYRKELR